MSAAQITALLAIAWGLAVVGVAWQRRPAPERIRALAPALAPRPTRPAPGGAPAAGGVAERLGAALLRRTGRRGGEVDAATARRVGLAVLAGLLFLPAVPPASVPAALVVWAMPGLRARRAHRRRLAALAADLPDVVDLLVLGVGAGLTVHLAVTRVAARAPGPLATELGRTMHEVTLGRRLSDALDDLPARAGEAMRPLVGALVASERYGAPLVAGLERLADEVRRDRRRQAEEAARKVPVKLLFPLVLCTLPAFGLLTVAPLVASAVRSLHL